MNDRIEHPMLTWLTVSILAATALVPLVVFGIGPEMARWDAAQAETFFRRGETEDALYQLRSAAQRSPRDPVVRLLLANRLIENGDPKEGIALANEVLERYPGHHRALETLARGDQKLGDFAGALKAMERFAQSGNSSSMDAGMLNNLSYFQALAESDLPLASANMDRAIGALTAQEWSLNVESLPVRSLVASVIIARHCNGQDDVRELLDQEIERRDAEVYSLRSKAVETVYRNSREEFPFYEPPENHVRVTRKLLRTQEESLAVLLTCRALLHQDAGRESLCDSDRLQVKELHFDASEIAGRLPGELECLQLLEAASQFLDTRGFVRGRLPWTDSFEDWVRLPTTKRHQFSHASLARRDLDYAILATRIFLKSLDSRLHNTMDDPVDLDELRKSYVKTLAIELNHRAMLNRRSGNAPAASSDEQEIRALGFTPGEQLY